MGSLRTLTILLALGAWGAATEGAPLDDGMSPASGTNRAPLPAPAAEYLKGGIRLYNTGDQALAAKYLKVANDYKDQLLPADVAQLNAYLAKLSSAPTDPAVKPAGTDTANDPNAPMGTTPISSPPMGSPRSTSDPKSEARWQLQAAKEQLRMGNYDEASRIVAVVQKMNIKWGLFDETPTKVADAIAKARPKATASAGSMAHDKKTAVAKLKEARELIANNQVEQAEALAMEVSTWGVSFSRFEDRPDKVAAAARAVRKRDELRNTPVKAQQSPEQYDILVSEARHFIALGQYDQAEAKAKQAARMNVYPSSTADRAEAVLNDITVARGSAANPMPSPLSANMPTTPKAPLAETASLVAEREANAALGRKDTKLAAAKFEEAQRLHEMELAGVTTAVAATAAPALDRSIQKVANNPVPDSAPVGLPGLDPLPQNPVTPVQPDPLAPPVLGGAEVAPTPIADPASPPVAMPVPEVGGLPSAAAPSLSSDVLPSGNKGEELLSQSKALFKASNWAAAREKAMEAKSGNYGVSAQADEMLAQIGLSEQGGALAVYEAALDAMRKGEFDRARALLTEVAASGSGLDEGMLEKVQGLLLKLPKDGGKGTATASDVPVDNAELLKAQQMNAEVGSKVAEARRMMEVDPEKAIEMLQTTLASVKAADMPQTVARTMTRRLEVAIELAKTDKVKFDEKMKDKSAKAEIETKKLRILEADKVKKEAIKDLMTKAEEAYANGDYAKAEELARRANEIDPNVIGPQMLVFKANTQRHYDLDVSNKKKKEEGFLTEMQSVDESMIIDPSLSRNGITYPKSFKEMSDRRKKAQLSDNRQKTIGEMALERKLNEPITLNLKEQSLDEAIAFIANYTGLNVVVDPRALNDEGLSRESKVSLTANSMKLKNALKYLLTPLGLTYKADDETLLITSPQASRDKTFNWTYPVADLVVPPNKLQSPNNSGGPGFPNANPADGTPMMVPTAVQNSQGGTWNPIARTVTMSDMMPLVQLITTTIAPGTWQVAYPDSEQNSFGMGGAFGGAGDAQPAQPGSITPFLLSISLIIRHTAEVHEEVAELLKQLRRLQDLQVSIEVRFITVSDDFFEQIVSTSTSRSSRSRWARAPRSPPRADRTRRPAIRSTWSAARPVEPARRPAGPTAAVRRLARPAVAQPAARPAAARPAAARLAAAAAARRVVWVVRAAAAAASLAAAAASAVRVTSAAAAPARPAAPRAERPAPAAPAARASATSSTRSSTTRSGDGPRSWSAPAPAASVTTPTTWPSRSPRGSAANIQPFNSIPSAGATFGISFLSDLEMYLFLTAAQGDARNNIVQAPRSRPSTGRTPRSRTPSSSTTSRSSPRSSAPDGLVLPDPGSAQRRCLPERHAGGLGGSSVRPALAGSDLPDHQRPPVVPGSGGGRRRWSRRHGDGHHRPDPAAADDGHHHQHHRHRPRRRHGAPGGVKRMREQRLEYGVPVLAKTPLINRLFRNIGIGRRTDSLMLMVTPRIIILEEEEDRLGVRTINSNP